MRVVLFANTDWFLYNFKLSLAKALRARGDEVVLLSPPGIYGPRLREMGFRWEPLPVSRSGINPLAELAAIRRVAALYREVRPDVVHHFTIKCVIYGSLAARRVGVMRIVNSVTGLGFALLANTLKARLIRPVVLALYGRALRGTQVIFQNVDNRNTLAAAGVLSQSTVHVIAGDGVDTERFVPALPAPDVSVLMMARLLRSKGIAEFVEAARRVRAQMPAVRFLLAGEPDPGNPESVDVESLQRWQSEGHVEFLGHRSDALELNQSCRVAVLASTQGEGVPRALLEAAACGQPLVASDVPGCREVVVDGVTGVLVPPSDADALAAAILRLLQDAELCERLGKAGRAFVEERFSDHHITALTFAVYDGTANPSVASKT
jgi:glycosyltransferase involved in cell wall biosynthesis